MRRAALIALGILLVVVAAVYLLQRRDVPSDITYGVSFSKLHADELGLDWKAVFLALLDDMQVRHFRLSAHWPAVEPADGAFDFSALDFQMQEAAARGADVILAVGHRTPGWPECHTPQWALDLSKEARQAQVLEVVRTTVERYKDAPNLKYFQVENEPYLHFATQYCDDLDEAFLQQEVALVKELAPGVPVLVTDSGEMGKWYGAWRAGDVFGTSAYLYVWYEPIGPIRYPIGSWFFRAKQTLLEMVMGKKETLLIELGLEPWLHKPIVASPREEQLARMDTEKVDEILTFAAKTGFSQQYLWGAEWWYYSAYAYGDTTFWDRFKVLFAQSAQ